MSLVGAAQQDELKRHIELCVRLAALGCDAKVMRLALQRRGVAPAAADLIGLSIEGSQAALKAITAQARARRDDDEAKAQELAQLRAARAARHFLGRMAAFFWIGVIAVGGGAALGWSIGFSQGASDGFDWALRALERLAGG
jgi:hypothetical protein